VQKDLKVTQRTLNKVRKTLYHVKPSELLNQATRKITKPLTGQLEITAQKKKAKKISP